MVKVKISSCAFSKNFIRPSVFRVSKKLKDLKKKVLKLVVKIFFNCVTLDSYRTGYLTCTLGTGLVEQMGQWGLFCRFFNSYSNQKLRGEKIKPNTQVFLFPLDLKNFLRALGIVNISKSSNAIAARPN